MKTRLIAAIAAISTLVAATPAKADPVNMKDINALAGTFCNAVADRSASLIPAFGEQYYYFGGLMSLDHSVTRKQMATVTNYAVTKVCPQLKPLAAAKVQSLYNWLNQQVNSGELNQINPDVKTEILTIGATIETLPF